MIRPNAKINFRNTLFFWFWASLLNRSQIAADWLPKPATNLFPRKRRSFRETWLLPPRASPRAKIPAVFREISFGIRSRTIFSDCCVLAGLASVLFVRTVFAASDLSGGWEFSANYLGNVSYARVTLKVEGDKLSGTLNELRLEGE